MKIITDIKKYIPYNEQEKKDKEVMLDFLERGIDVFSRKNKMAHFTASAWVVNKKKEKSLMVYHNIYDSWSWMGGHADGDVDLFQVAKREAMEESGLKNIDSISDEIFSLEILAVDGHIKNNQYVSSHLHFNITYLLVGDEKEELVIKADENSGVKWYRLEEAIEMSSEKWFRNNIYTKLNEKLKLLI